MNEKKFSASQIASTFIGVTIGAGFASGQEVLQFFAFFGLASFAAILLAALLFAFFAGLILDAGARLQAASHREVVMHATGKAVGLAVDLIITFFLFGSFTAMLAGAGSALNQQFGFPYYIGPVFIAFTALATVMSGLSGIVSVLGFLAPTIITAIVLICGAVLTTYSPGFQYIGLFYRPLEAALPSWPLSTAAYVSYNIILTIAIMAPMGKLAKSQKDIRTGALAGGIGLGTGILAIYLSIVLVPDSFGYSIPMSYVAGIFSPLAGSGYTIILLAATYATSVGSLYGFCARFACPGTPRFKVFTAVIAVTAVLASAIGFTNLVKFLYSGVGIAGFLLLGGLTRQYILWRLKGPHLLT